MVCVALTAHHPLRTTTCCAGVDQNAPERQRQIGRAQRRRGVGRQKTARRGPRFGRRRRVAGGVHRPAARCGQAWRFVCTCADACTCAHAYTGGICKSDGVSSPWAVARARVCHVSCVCVWRAAGGGGAAAMRRAAPMADHPPTPCARVPAGKGRRLQYKVKWQGWSEEHNSWVNKGDVSEDLVVAFLARERQRAHDAAAAVTAKRASAATRPPNASNSAPDPAPAQHAGPGEATDAGPRAGRADTTRQLFGSTPVSVRVASRSSSPPWRSIRFRLALRTYAPWGVRVVSQTKARKIPTRKNLPLFFASRARPTRCLAAAAAAARRTDGIGPSRSTLVSAGTRVPASGPRGTRPTTSASVPR